MFICLLVISYLIGNLSFGLISAKLFKLQDPRTFGSKNIGATNILRSGNKKAAIFTLLGDLLKGCLAVGIAVYFQKSFGLTQEIIVYSGLCVFLGHVYPIFLKFKGGKGVATIAGALLVINPIIGFTALSSWLLSAFLFRYSSLSAIIASLFTIICSAIIYRFNSEFYTILLMVIILLYKHKTNIINLINKQEPKIGKK